jgi:parvulin-like peptidyl-prolyl isomerase
MEEHNHSTHHTETHQSKEVNNLKSFAIGFVVLVVLAAVGFVGFNVYQVYAKSPTDGFGLKLAQTLHLPIAKINGETILYADYADDLRALKSMIAYEKQNGGGEGTPSFTPEQMSDQVLLRLSGNILLNKLAAQYNVKAEDKDIQDLKNQVLAQFAATPTNSTTPANPSTKEAEDKANEELKKRYGWDFKTYEQKVMVPYVLQTKISEKLSSDETVKKQIKDTAQQVLDRIKKGEKFEDLAKQYGEDGTAQNGGDLGWFKKGDMVASFEQAAFALKKGEVSPNLVETEYGYHIVRVDDKKTEKVKDTAGKMVDSEQVQAHHILFRFPEIGKTLDNEMKKADVKIYGKVHNPFEELKKQAA